MGKINYLGSLIYPTKELCTCSMTFRRDSIEDNSCQILTNSDQFYREEIIDFIS
ncbi:hypothetical protein GW17_00046975 [Ensete ventricosum]|nr:hypothetical protein GW17_00046975 [Ensete ventricosum]